MSTEGRSAHRGIGFLGARGVGKDAGPSLEGGVGGSLRGSRGSWWAGRLQELEDLDSGLQGISSLGFCAQKLICWCFFMF